MRLVSRLIAALVPVTGVLVLAAAPASADFYAVTQTHKASSSNADLVRIDLTTHQEVPLPAGVNTNAGEFHPSLSPDGKRLVFERTTAATTRIVVTDLGTGESTDLLSAFQVPTVAPNTPTFISNSTVALGAPFVPSGTGTNAFRAKFTTVNISSFPSPPFPLAEFVFPQILQGPGRSLQLDDHGTLVTGVRVENEQRGEVLSNNSAGQHVLQGSDSFEDPTVSVAEQVVVMVRRGPAGTRLVFTPLSLTNPIDLPVHGSDPEFSSDGRYLAFVADKDGQDMLLIWDTQTQLVLQGVGANLGPHDGSLLRTDDAVSLHQETVLLSSTIFASGQINLHLALPSQIGIIVQRVIGRTRVLGHSAPKLQLVGRVPLGHFGTGAGHIRWDKKVNGRRLPAGLYQVTVRSVTSGAAVRDLGHPVLLRIGRH